MTVIVAKTDGDVVLMGCDSSSITDDGKFVVRRGNTKVWKFTLGSEDIMIGFCGTFAVGSWVRYGFEWPAVQYPIKQWLVVDVVPALRESIAKRFRLDNKDEFDTTFILCFRRPGRIFVLSPCGDVEEPSNTFTAIGSGSEIALGAMSTLKMIGSDLMSWDEVDIALKTSEQHHSSVHGPMHILAL